MKQLSKDEVRSVQVVSLCIILIGLLPWAWVDVLLAFLIFAVTLGVNPRKGRDLKATYDGLPLNEIGLRGKPRPVDDTFEFTLTDDQAEELRKAWGLDD